MPAFFLALLAAALATVAGREAVRVARLAQALGSGFALLAVLWLATIASSACVAWFGAELGAQMASPAMGILVALALLFAAGEVLLLRPPAVPREATRSIPAILFVLLGAQLTDAARLMVLALAAAGGSPVLAGAGGAAGSGVALTFAWALGAQWESRLPLSAIRWAVAGVLVLAAGLPGLTALGVVG